jgi:hypothetical protein
LIPDQAIIHHRDSKTTSIKYDDGNNSGIENPNYGFSIDKVQY